MAVVVVVVVVNGEPTRNAIDDDGVGQKVEQGQNGGVP